MNNAYLTVNGLSFAQKQPKKELPESVIYGAFDYISAGFSASDIVKLGLCPKELEGQLNSYINRLNSLL